MNNDIFEFSYSAAEQQEVKDIRDKYLPRTEDKMEQLRRLDASVTRKGGIISLILGVIGALILGGGMSMVMVADGLMLPGIIIGIIGIIGVALAYPVYNAVTEKERKRIAPEILKLTEELMK